MIYQRNRIYISADEQEKMRGIKIVLGGLGLGSMIAECALRLGFTNLHLIDGDSVEPSNLNRQNYTQSDIGEPKTQSLFKRLKAINPDANIKISNVFLDSENIKEHLTDADIAVNALDFTTDVPFIFDQICSDCNIPIIHPYNLGYGALGLVFNKNSMALSKVEIINEKMEINVVHYVINQLQKSGEDMSKLINVLEQYTCEKTNEQPPQLSIGSYLVAGLCCDIFLSFLKNEEIAFFPKFYYIEKNVCIFE